MDLDSDDRDEWARILGLSLGDLKYLSANLSKSTEFPVDSTSLVGLVRHGLSESVEDAGLVAEALAKNLVRLAGLRIEETSIDQPLREEISEALVSAGISSSGIDQLEEIWPELEYLARFEQFGVAYKASELLFDNDRSMLDVRIITDLRPVFSLDGSRIVGSVAINVLKIEFLEGGEIGHVSISVDQGDLEKLQGVSEYAREKTHEVVRFFSSKIGTGFVAAEDDQNQSE